MTADIYDVQVELIVTASGQGGTADHRYKGPTSRSDRAVKYLPGCTCGWSMSTDDFDICRYLWQRHIDEEVGGT